MSIWDAIGYLASCLVITAFCMKDITRLRVAAVASNVAFLVYGIALGLAPVWVLHGILLPVNLWRLRQCVAAAPANSSAAPPGRRSGKHKGPALSRKPLIIG